MAHILVRLSKLVDEEGGLERQEADCREYCSRLGLPVDRVWKEVQSAYAGKTREVLESALEGAAGGDLVVWKLDRLTRRGMVSLGALLARMDRDGTVLHSVTENIDAGTHMGRSVLGVLAGVAAQSSADASLRIRRAFEEMAKDGVRHKGGKRPFGWGEGEPELVRDAANRIIAGESLRSICRDWNERGLKTSSWRIPMLGGEWQSSPLSRLLRSESLIGVRTHLNQRYKAEWPAILTEAEFSAVGAALRKNKAHPRGGRTLLAGLLVCGGCGARMTSTSASEKSGRLRYSCIKKPGTDRCGRVSIYRDLADAEVERQVEEMWAIWEAAAPAPVVNWQQQLLSEREALAQLVHDHYVARLIPRELFLPSYQELQDRIAELESQEVGVITLTAQTIEQKLKASVSFVDVIPAGRTGPRKPISERVLVRFRFGWTSQRAGMVVE